jgi:hypothetical protein
MMAATSVAAFSREEQYVFFHLADLDGGAGHAACTLTALITGPPRHRDAEAFSVLEFSQKSECRANVVGA